MYINFIDKDRLYLIEKDNEYKDLDEALERFFANEEIVSLYSLTFIYNDNQEMIFRKNWKEKTGKELLDDIVSIFDKRKMNRCFNYDNIYNRRTKEEVVEKIENQLFSKWEYNDRALIRKYLRKVIELDQKIYKSERDKILEDLKTFKEEIKQDLLKDGISEEVKEICKKLYFKYDLIEKYDFSLLTAIIPKKLFKERRKLKIGLDKTIENLEKLVLDESYENIYDYARVALKKYLKKYFGKGLTEEKVKTFYKYVEKYDLEEMITEEKSIIISKLSQKISKANWNKGKKMLPLANDKINLIREFITFQSYRNINRERKKLVEFFRTIIKEKKMRKKH